MNELSRAGQEQVRRRLATVFPGRAEPEPPQAPEPGEPAPLSGRPRRSEVSPWFGVDLRGGTLTQHDGPMDPAAFDPDVSAFSELERGPAIETPDRPDPDGARLDGSGRDGPGPDGPGLGGGAFDPVRWRVFDPGRRGVRALGAVAVVVLLIAGFFAWRARPREEPVAAPPAAADATADPTADPADPSAAAEIVLSVAGKVRRPGLVRLAPGARLSDAIAAAGGAEPGVDVAMLNPARKVVDGELVVVGVPPPPGVVGGPVGPGAAPGGRLNLNTATLAQLDGLPGVGPVLAQRILDHREKQGGFRAVTDLRKVNGIGAARFDDLKDQVTV